MLVQRIKDTGKNISELLEPLKKYARSKETTFELKDNDEIFKRSEEEYSDGERTKLDGLSVDYNDWWFNIRASNTEPIIKLSVEAETQDLLTQKVKEITELINS